jgi:hypothetical protein
LCAQEQVQFPLGDYTAKKMAKDKANGGHVSGLGSHPHQHQEFVSENVTVLLIFRFRKINTSLQIHQYILIIAPYDQRYIYTSYLVNLAIMFAMRYTEFS